MPVHESYNRKFKEHISIPEVDKSFNPGDNFYKYVNAEWLNTTVIPKDRVSYSVNEEIEKIIEKDLFEILDNSTTNSDTKLKSTVSMLATSAKKSAHSVSALNTLHNGLQKIKCARNTEDIGHILGYFARLKINTFLGAYTQLERTVNNKNIYTLVFSLGDLGLPDTSYYSATAPGKINTLLSYIKMCTRLAKELDLEDLTSAITLESFLSAHLNNALYDSSKLFTGVELATTFKRFPFDSFFKSYGILHWKEYKYRIQSVPFMHCLEHIFYTVSLMQWKQLFMLHLVLSSLTLLPNPYDNYYFEFYGQILHDQEEKIKKRYLALSIVKEYATKQLSTLYVKSYLHNDLKVRATKFIETVRSSALKRIEQNSWMCATTKKEAYKKLKHMNLCIGWPESYPPLICPTLTSDNLLENTYLLSEASTVEDIRLLNKESVVGKWWNEPAFMVNAYYYNEINEYIIPAASLLYPFYGKSLGWDYGGLGSVIGHEMVHAFDENGKKYDHYGLEKKWWQSKDIRRFKKLSHKLVELFNRSKIQGHSVDGLLTLNENLADLGGVSIALDALKTVMNQKNLTVKEQSKEIRDFFISYAVSWRTVEKKKKILEELFMDKHSPPELRVNNIVSQYDEWYEVFNISKTDKLYIAPEDRIRIF